MNDAARAELDADPHRFTLDTLGDLGQGQTRTVINDALNDALADCEARPGEEAARTVTITIKLAPEPSPSGGLAAIEANATVKLTVPKRQARSTVLTAGRRGDRTAAFLPAADPAPLFTTTSQLHDEPS